MTARRFYREQRPPDFEGIGSLEIGRQYAMQIRARTEELAFALSPTVIDRHKIRSGRSEADAQPRTGGSSRREGRLPEPWRRDSALSKAWAFGPDAIARWSDCRHGDAPFELCFSHRSIGRGTG